MITERTLKGWRRNALKSKENFDPKLYEGTAESLARSYIELQDRILKLTQELLDQHLLRK